MLSVDNTKLFEDFGKQFDEAFQMGRDSLGRPHDPVLTRKRSVLRTDLIELYLPEA